jgi:outer membrane protein insertion porin family
MARRFQERGLVPDLILASAAARTRETAETFAKVLGVPTRLLQADDSLYLAEGDAIHAAIRGVGPRVLRQQYVTAADGTQTVVTDRNQIVDDALGGRAYYLARAEIEIPLGSGARELGLRPTIYAQVGSLFGITRPLPTATFPTSVDANGNVTVLPINTPLFDSAGRQLYFNTYTPTGATETA